MVTRYVGIGGNDANSGLTWPLRKLTLNGVEDTPVVAGDLVRIGPGVYRELLTCDVDGGAGTEIIYQGDNTGAYTDGIGGIVRVTSSDNDQTGTRNQCVDGNGKDYRTFRGFHFDTALSECVLADGSPVGWDIEDCTFENGVGGYAIVFNGDAQNDNNVRRCKGWGIKWGQTFIKFVSAGGAANAASLVENCGWWGVGAGVWSDRVGGITVRNCAGLGSGYFMIISIALPGGFTAVTVNNCAMTGYYQALRSVNLGELVENFNTLAANGTDRVNVAVGANSQTYPILLSPPLLYSGQNQASGYKFPWRFGDLSRWSAVRAIIGANEPAVDLHGFPRPTTAAKNSWGAQQFNDMAREATITRGGSTASITLADAGRHHVWVPVTNVATTIRVYVQRGVNYAGVNPQMIIKQPGQINRTTTDTGLSGAWNLLTDTFTPAATPSYVIVELVSNNTAAAGAYAAYFDDLCVD